MKYSKADNIFSLDGWVHNAQEEHVEALYHNQQVKIKRIVSHRHTSPPGQWYDQSEDEWVVLLQGKASLEFEDGHLIHMMAGDHIMIEAGTKHRVSYTSHNPSCIWVAVYIQTPNSTKA